MILRGKYRLKGSALEIITPDLTRDGRKMPRHPDGNTAYQQPVPEQAGIFESVPEESEASAPASSLAHDMIDRQEIYSDAAKPSHKRGIILICLGVIMLLAAGIFCAHALFSTPSTITMTQLAQYEVPDGMLQEGAIDSGTDVLYVYDLDADDVPYAVESHATVSGLFGTTDLYEKWDGEKAFSEELTGNSASGDATNYRKIVIHLPDEAKGYVAGDSANGQQVS